MIARHSILVILLVANTASAQVIKVTLISGRTYDYVQIEKLEGDSLHLKGQRGTKAIPYRIIVTMDVINQIVVVRNGIGLLGATVSGGIIGSCIGFFSGGLLGKSEFEWFTPGSRKGHGWLLGGAIIGSLTGVYAGQWLHTWKESTRYDFEQMTSEQKLKTIQGILAKTSTSPAL